MRVARPAELPRWQRSNARVKSHRTALYPQRSYNVLRVRNECITVFSHGHSFPRGRPGLRVLRKIKFASFLSSRRPDNRSARTPWPRSGVSLLGQFAFFTWASFNLCSRYSHCSPVSAVHGGARSRFGLPIISEALHQAKKLWPCKAQYFGGHASIWIWILVSIKLSS